MNWKTKQLLEKQTGFIGEYIIDRSIHYKKLLFIKYVYGQEILMLKSPISIILSLKAGAHCIVVPEPNSGGLKNQVRISQFCTIGIYFPTMYLLHLKVVWGSSQK